MTAPRFSLVVPTRNRARTLAFHLRTCLAQDFDDFEVVVSDNFSTPDVRETALSFGDPRIRYCRTPADLSMTDSFEFAVEQARGEYISMLGDDDGYLLHALEALDGLLAAAQAPPALRWDSVLYNWPDILPQGYAEPGTLLLPLRQGSSGHVLQRCESAPMVQAAADGRISYADLPMVLCSVIRRDVLDRLRQRTGRVFRSRTADVYGALAIASVAGTHYSIDAPMTISGTSAASTGIARHFLTSGSPIEEQFRCSADAAGHAWHASVPDLPPIAASVADSVRYLQEALGSDAPVTLDRRRVVELVLSDVVAHDEAAWQHALAACRRSLRDDPALLAWFDATHAARPRPQAAARRQAPRRYGGSYMALDAAEHGVSDVMSAAALCEKLLGYKRDGVRYVVREQPAELQAPLSELEEKERQIQIMSAQIRRLEGPMSELEEKERQIQIMKAKIGELDAALAARSTRGSRLRRLFRRRAPKAGA